MNVVHSLSGLSSNLGSLGRLCSSIVVYVCKCCTVEVVEAAEGSSIGSRNIAVLVKPTVLLSLLQSRCIQTGTIQNAGLHIVVRLQSVCTIIEQPGHSLDVHVISIPVRRICLEYNGILLGQVGYKVRTAVCDGIGSLAVLVAVSAGIILGTELTALRYIVISGHGSKYAITKHGHKVRAGLGNSVLKGVVIDCLYAYLREIGYNAVNVLVCIDDHALNQVLQAAHSVHHMLHTCNKVVSLHISNLTALRIYPRLTLADLEGIGKTICGNLIALSKCRLQNVLTVVLHQTVIGVDDLLAVCLLGCSKYIPGSCVRGICAVGIGVLQSISLFYQIILCPLLICAGTYQLGPLLLHLLVHFLGQRLGGNDQRMESIGVIAPQHAGTGTGSDSGDRIVTASGLQRKHCSILHQLCLSDSHLCISEGKVFLLLLGSLINGVEISQISLKQIAAGSIVIHLSQLICNCLCSVRCLNIGAGFHYAGLLAAG